MLPVATGCPHWVAFRIPTNGSTFLSRGQEFQAAAHSAVGALAAHAAGALGHTELKEEQKPGVEAPGTAAVSEHYGMELIRPLRLHATHRRNLWVP